MAEALKAEGNKAFAAKDYETAIAKFTGAIELDASNHVLYSNRSACYASLKKFDEARADAEMTTELKPDWSKGWARKGAALHGLRDLMGSMDAYEEAVKLDPSNAQAKSGLESVERAIQSEGASSGGDPMGGIGNMFSDPQLIQKLAANPKTSSLLADPQFMAKLQRIQQNPGSLSSELGDPRFMQVLGVLMGIDLTMSERPAGESGEGESGSRVEEDEDVPMPDFKRTPSGPTQTKKAPEPEPEPEPEDEEAIAAKKAKAEAEKEKALGTASYKKRDFDTAIGHYEKAWDLHKDITYLTNLGAAKYEKGDYQGAIEACEKAIEEGREVLADFKLIAKAFGRIGSSYEKLANLPLAITNYQHSLTEHRTPEILTKLRAAEKAKIDADKTAYINPEEADKAREKGNLAFKEADWPAAVAAYSDMIARAPDDPRGYSNRAAAFIKLMTFPSAVEDCDAAIARDPTFVRAFLRKAQAYFAMRKFDECIETCSQASAADAPLNKNAREIAEQNQRAMEAMYTSREGETEEQAQARIQNDPEVLAILADPVMQSILQQAKNDPAALQEHMRNPGIAGKVRKLVGAGVIRLGR